MPYYTFKCSVCGVEWVEKRSIEDRDNTPKCCGEQQTERQLDAPFVAIDQPAAGKST
jgi:putative FmdB family regulatory protein